MSNSIDGLVHKDLEINIYRILQESFNNVVKHAKASKIDLEIFQKNNFLEISFKDNGIGFDQNSPLNGQGILGIKERISLLKGTLSIISDANTGTLLLIKIPILT